MEETEKRHFVAQRLRDLADALDRQDLLLHNYQDEINLETGEVNMTAKFITLPSFRSIMRTWSG